MLEVCGASCRQSLSQRCGGGTLKYFEDRCQNRGSRLRRVEKFSYSQKELFGSLWPTDNVQKGMRLGKFSNF